MFVRWQTYKPRDLIVPKRRYTATARLSAILVESVRIDGKPRHRHVAFLGSLGELYRDDHHCAEHNPAIVLAFWRRVLKTLDRLHNRIAAEQREKIIAAISKKIGHLPPTPADVQEWERGRDAWQAGLIAAFGDKSEGPERERRKKIFNARRHGKACAKCEHEFGPNEEVYRLRLHIGYGLMHGARHCIAPVCHDCFENYVQSWGVNALISTSKCENCNRTVNEIHYRRQRRNHRYYCCDDCRQKHAPRFYREKARQERAQHRKNGLSRKPLSTPAGPPAQ